MEVAVAEVADAEVARNKAADAEVAVVVQIQKTIWKAAKPVVVVMVKAEAAAVTNNCVLNLFRLNKISYFYKPEAQPSGLLILKI